MREWLNSNPVNREDMLRHDKWRAMMCPRLKLLHELLADTGSFWMTLDDNEVHRARMMLDEIFGEENFVATISWQNKVSPANDAKYFSDDFDFILVYAKNKTIWLPNGLERTEEQEAYYLNPDNDLRGLWNSATYTCNKSRLERPNLYYAITNPFTGEEVWPSETAVWRFSKEKHIQLEEQGFLYWGTSGTAKMPRLKRFLSEMGNIVPRTVWNYSDVGHTQGAMTELKSLLGIAPFQTPKPVSLLQRILQIATTEDSLILDSFAGSATTAHAVLAQNAKDGGNRKFILVECEDYADTLTAERVRRVNNGYDYKGTQKEDLYRETITWTNFSKEGAHHKLLQHVHSIENLDGLRFDSIKKEIKDGELIVTGENKITERVAGLGGGFTFYTLGEPLDIDKILTGETLPDYQTLGAWLFHTATGQPLKVEQTDADRWYLGSSDSYHVWLIYRPELDFLKSREAALTFSLAEQIGNTYKDKPHLVFATAKYVPNKMLLPLGVEHAPPPFALYRMEKD